MRRSTREVPLNNELHIHDLLRPEAYPPPQPRQIALATTHASWVLLGEHEVWKIKRPVNFGFLDFSTSTARERCCREELRLGVRLAPDVYQEVVPVFWHEGRSSFVGPGEVIDHALRMRRLPDDQSARALLTSGCLNAHHLQALAGRLVPFYGEVPSEDRGGSSDVLLGFIAQNEAQCQPLLGRLFEPERLRALGVWQRRQVEEHRARLQSRAQRGRVRDGHGDLRLEHVYFPPSAGPLVIDPIEFNRSLRCADVALDVSFLAMELAGAGRADLAASFMSAWARGLDDHDAYPLLDLFVSYRAWVRAKVAALVTLDPSTPQDECARKETEAKELFALAETFARPRHHPQVIIAVGGLIGTGKSTIADALTMELGLPVVSSDHVRKHLAGVPLEQRGGPELYSPEHTQRTYAEVLRRAELVLSSGRGVVLDATFTSAHHREAARTVARAHGLRFLFVHAVATDEVLRRRLAARAQGPRVSDADEALLDAQRARFEPPTELPPAERLEVDANRPSSDLAREVRTRLGERSPPTL